MKGKKSGRNKKQERDALGELSDILFDISISTSEYDFKEANELWRKFFSILHDEGMTGTVKDNSYPYEWIIRTSSGEKYIVSPETIWKLDDDEK
jgi:aminopeptidase-like protein